MSFWHQGLRGNSTNWREARLQHLHHPRFSPTRRVFDLGLQRRIKSRTDGRRIGPRALTTSPPAAPRLPVNPSATQSKVAKFVQGQKKKKKKKKRLDIRAVLPFERRHGGFYWFSDLEEHGMSLHFPVPAHNLLFSFPFSPSKHIVIHIFFPLRLAFQASRERSDLVPRKLTFDLLKKNVSLRRLAVSSSGIYWKLGQRNNSIGMISTGTLLYSVDIVAN